MRKTLFTISTLASLVIIIAWIAGSCKKPNDTDDALEQVIPQGFPQPHYRFADNPLTKDGVELGRRLFYDGRLSVDGFHPCSSCHQQIAGFGTYEHDRSHGVHDSHTLRNAPVLFNLAWNTSFHWDGEFLTLADEAVHPITGQTEMGETFNRVIRKIENDIEYKRLFKKVFHTDVILPVHIQKALAQFTGTIVVFNSKYDRVKKGEASFTAQETAGYQLYQSNCASCHPEPLFTDYSYRNIGLPVEPFLNDFGRMRITGRREDSLKFKVPTLRNTYISANYMHDGRFNTFAQVLTHYRSNVQPGPTLDPLLTNGITMTNTDAINLALFLRALTDSALLNDPRYGPPQ
ncbi:MAG TPA: cytochrome c peroxidase [Chitinophagaceae bacterium]|nr:cytochrome c peroxidase [Chitinophagaceae bacterium]